MVIVEAKNIVKRFGKITALNGISLTVNRGIEGLIGPNGAGKTTFINIILGLIRPDEGYISVFGMNPWRDGAEIRERVGVLHEKPQFPKNFTGREYLEIVGSFYGYGKYDVIKKVNKIIRIIDLEKFVDRKIGTYSAGMVQRLGLAQALIGDPEFVILDEPTANLDPTSRIEFLELIARLYRDEGISFLISTHILSELERVCQRVSIICDGIIRERGSLIDLTKKYVTQYLIEVKNPKKLYDRLRDESIVEKIEFYDTKIFVETRNWREFQKILFRIILDNNIEVISVLPRYGALEQVYRKVVG
ncbi:MAG: hypothetical protein DRJ34_00700 [Thermoprotei archaeon]|nr:MAG: hypothetical protein DRJ34_00700 [Thermoprotei archaeon]RLE71938.1 MAG: hypothetical protein DRJ45_02730 [Thermoprotei archaeon]